MILPALLVSAALAAGAAPSRPVLMVAYFDNNSGEAGLDVLKKGLADMIVTDLVAWDGVTVVERERLEEVMKELSLQRSKAFDQKTAVRIGKHVGAQYVLMGSFATAGNELRIDARLVQNESSQVVASAQVSGGRDAVFELEQQLVDKITAGIDLRVSDAAARRKVKAPSLEALLAYSKAIDLSDQGKVEEAQKAMQAIVSRSPTFLMAREKKEAILEKLKELEKRRGELVTESALRLGQLADEALAREARFDALGEEAQQRFLSMRAVKGLFLARLLKQHLSWRDPNLRIILVGHEAQALAILRSWLENQHKLVDEHARFVRQHRDALPRERLEPEVRNLLGDARMGDVSLAVPLRELVRFVIDGQLDDGKGYTVAPALGDLDPKERDAAFALLEERIGLALKKVLAADAAGKKEAEQDATALIELKAELLLDLRRDEEAVGEYQRILDTFPTSSRAGDLERTIKKLIGAAGDREREAREHWAKALSDGCADEKDLWFGSETVLRDRLHRMGLRALAAHAAELEKACKITGLNSRAFADVYMELALLAANHEDCEAYRAWLARYAEVGGSSGEMKRLQDGTPWCEPGDVTRVVTWMTATRDLAFDYELDGDLKSQLRFDGSQLTIYGEKNGGEEWLSLYLDPAGQGWTCRQAEWKSRSEGQIQGSCTVKLTSVADGPGSFDEGTFSATFDVKAPPRRIELSEGKLRVRRK